MGIVWESFVLLRTLGPYPLESSRALVGLPILILAVAGLFGPRRQALASVVLVPSVIFFVIFFGWYQPIASGDRFLVPVLIPLLVSASVGVVDLGNFRFSDRWLRE
jgi:hypothetical protein